MLYSRCLFYIDNVYADNAFCQRFYIGSVVADTFFANGLTFGNIYADTLFDNGSTLAIYMPTLCLTTVLHRQCKCWQGALSTVLHWQYICRHYVWQRLYIGNIYADTVFDNGFTLAIYMLTMRWQRFYIWQCICRHFVGQPFYIGNIYAHMCLSTYKRRPTNMFVYWHTL